MKGQRTNCKLPKFSALRMAYSYIVYIITMYYYVLLLYGIKSENTRRILGMRARPCRTFLAGADENDKQY